LLKSNSIKHDNVVNNSTFFMIINFKTDANIIRFVLLSKYRIKIIIVIVLFMLLFLVLFIDKWIPL
jgi:hypothetical protein